jgi:Domain of unknown function (DUF2760)
VPLPCTEGQRFMEPYLIVITTIAAVVVVEFFLLLAAGGGSLSRLGIAWPAFRRILSDAGTAERVRALLTAPAAPPKPARRSGEPLRLLRLLQRDAKMVDFLMQDISGASDGDIAVFVRDMHPKAQKVLKEHLVVAPVLLQNEGETVEVPRGFDPSAIQLLGNITGQPPYRGTLKHPGWRVADYTLPAPAEGLDELVLAPAEVDLP